MKEKFVRFFVIKINALCLQLTKNKLSFGPSLKTSIFISLNYAKIIFVYSKMFIRNVWSLFWVLFWVLFWLYSRHKTKQSFSWSYIWHFLFNLTMWSVFWIFLTLLDLWSELRKVSNNFTWVILHKMCYIKIKQCYLSTRLCTVKLFNI